MSFRSYTTTRKHRWQLLKLIPTPSPLAPPSPGEPARLLDHDGRIDPAETPHPRSTRAKGPPTRSALCHCRGSSQRPSRSLRTACDRRAGAASDRRGPLPHQTNARRGRGRHCRDPRRRTRCARGGHPVPLEAGGLHRQRFVGRSGTHGPWQRRVEGLLPRRRRARHCRIRGRSVGGHVRQLEEGSRRKSRRRPGRRE